MQPDPLSTNMLAAIEDAVDLQFKNSLTAFDTWFNDLDIAELLPPNLDFPKDMLPRAKDGIRSMCLLGWRARECEIIMFNLRAAAMRDVVKDTERLRAEVEKLTTENAELRAATRSQRRSETRDALVRRMVARRQSSGLS